jgi:hypothetical protein
VGLAPPTPLKENVGQMRKLPFFFPDSHSLISCIIDLVVVQSLVNHFTQSTYNILNLNQSINQYIMGNAKQNKQSQKNGDSAKAKRDRRQKREEYRAAMKQEGVAELPRKKFYRQRAHANPFSDHRLV